MKSVIIWQLGIYKMHVSPILVKLFGNACRFTPTCSEYTIEALKKYGALKGIFLGIKRLSRCNPFGGQVMIH